MASSPNWSIGDRPPSAAAHDTAEAATGTVSTAAATRGVASCTAQRPTALRASHARTHARTKTHIRVRIRETHTQTHKEQTNTSAAAVSPRSRLARAAARRDTPPRRDRVEGFVRDVEVWHEMRGAAGLGANAEENDVQARTLEDHIRQPCVADHSACASRACVRADAHAPPSQAAPSVCPSASEHIS
jgi:hypothetical protein